MRNPMSSRFNWRLWSGLALSVAAFASYFLFFIRFPVTRDMPWLTLILFVIAIVLLVTGLRKTAGRRVVAWIVTILGIGVATFFCVAVLIGTKMLPPSTNAPAIGAKAPGFVLPDTNRRPVALAQLLAEPGTKGVILIFYRGYW
jgi:hypothetical protein